MCLRVHFHHFHFDASKHTDTPTILCDCELRLFTTKSKWQVSGRWARSRADRFDKNNGYIIIFHVQCLLITYYYYDDYFSWISLDGVESETCIKRYTFWKRNVYLTRNSEIEAQKPNENSSNGNVVRQPRVLWNVMVSIAFFSHRKRRMIKRNAYNTLG